LKAPQTTRSYRRADRALILILPHLLHPNPIASLAGISNRSAAFPMTSFSVSGGFDGAEMFSAVS
jgi:hypothetical protein